MKCERSIVSGNSAQYDRIVGASRSTRPTREADLFTQVSDVCDESDQPVPMSPERLGRFELILKLASGGMADVYLARDGAAPRLDQVVALKRIHAHLVGESGYRNMFLDEARIAFQIVHPNVCPVFDFGESNGEYYLTMEYLVGESLARLLNRVAKGPLRVPPAYRACRLAHTIADACAGLHAAHTVENAHGTLLQVVHRDVTPRNLFLTYDGTTKVLDFGLATARMKRLHSRNQSELRGTLSYMAPEQLSGGPTDRRVDIWALGVTFWEMLAMRRLFRRDSQMAMASAILYDEIPPPSEVAHGVPKAFDSVVLKALRRNPEARWQTAHQMGLAIRQVLDVKSELIGPADLSQWINDVFPFGEARKRQLVRFAQRGSHDAVGRMPAEGK